MKKYFNLVRHLLICFFVLLTAGCGYVSDKPLSEIAESEKMKTCQIDLSKLSEIFKKDQTQQIRCIQENFIQFTKYVRTTSSGSVNESDMNEFIRKFFQDQSETIVKGLSLIFQLNMILLKDEADSISRGNISNIFDLLVEVNRDAIIITEILMDMSKEENKGRFWELRSKFNATVNHFAETTLQIISKKQGGQQLNLKTFIIEAVKKLGTKEVDADTIESALFIKKILLAGDREIITSRELEKLIEKLPGVLTLSFDLFYVSGDNFTSDDEHARFYLDNLRELYRIIEFNQDNFELLTIEQLTTLIKKVLGPESKLNIDKFVPTIKALKTRILLSQGDAFMLQDVKTIIGIFEELNEQLYFDTLTYDAFQETLSTPKAIDNLQFVKLPGYEYFSARRLKELQDNFRTLAVKFKYFRDPISFLPFYGSEFKRPKYGFIELSSIRLGVNKLFKGYGHPTKSGERQVSLEEFQTFLLDMKPVLEEFRLWTNDFKNFARNAVFLADLFQHQSNGDFGVSISEGTEYTSMILSAVQLNDQLRKELRTCDRGINKDEPLLDVTCFNDHLFPSLMDNLNYDAFFPRLHAYLNSASPEEGMAFLKGVEGFAREKNDPKIPINKREFTLILGALLNIESTFIRFDVNKDNLIDNQTVVKYEGDKPLTELDVAFQTYRTAIINVAKLEGDNQKYAQAIFLYMIKFMEIPPQKEEGAWLKNLINDLKFLKFYFFDSKKPIYAKRLNVGTILYYLVNPSPQDAKTKVKTL